MCDFFPCASVKGTMSLKCGSNGQMDHPWCWCMVVRMRMRCLFCCTGLLGCTACRGVILLAV